MNSLLIGKRRLWLIVTTLGFCAVLLWAMSGTDQGQHQESTPTPALPVTVVEVRPTQIRLGVEALGLSQARWPTLITATVSGRVEFLHDQLNPGTLLDADTVLVKLQDELYRAELAQAHAQVAAAELQLAQIKNEQYVVTELHPDDQDLAFAARIVVSQQHKYAAFSEGRPREALFDLEEDPGETSNLAADPSKGQVLAEHRRYLRQWIEETPDRDFPLPTG